MLDEIESITVLKDEKDDRKRKTNKTLSEVKLVENVSKNPQSFLEISLVQKKFLPLHKPCM